MACHVAVQGRIAESTALQQSILQGALMRDDAGCICESCRLLSTVLAGSHASAWLKENATEALATRLAWLLEATQNSDVLERSGP